MLSNPEIHNLTELALVDHPLTNEQASKILSSDWDLLSLVHAAYAVRQKYWDNTITVHIINNAANGFCPEDCKYCAQAKTSKADIEEYPIKSDDEFLAEAKNAYEKGAHRYCMVFAGRGPSTRRTERLANLIRKIKEKYPIEVCVSAGLLDEEKAKTLKEAGLDRLNHNLNTSEKHYDKICTTHTFQDRMSTLLAARKAGLQLCSGLIVGMNESIQDIIEVAFTARSMKIESIPVNFFIPILGNTVEKPSTLTPEFCIRVLCLFRFLNPQAEIRIAAGRELHLRSLEVLALYPANSLFLEGYLNTRGSDRFRTLKMIKDAGFKIKSDFDAEEILAKEEAKPNSSNATDQFSNVIMKNLQDLRPYQKST